MASSKLWVQSGCGLAAIYAATYLWPGNKQGQFAAAPFPEAVQQPNVPAEPPRFHSLDEGKAQLKLVQVVFR